MGSSSSRDRSTVGAVYALSTSTGFGKFNRDRNSWNEAKNNIECRLIQDDLNDFVESKFEDIILEDQKDELKDKAKALKEVKRRENKAWATIVSQLSGAALILAQQKEKGNAYDVWSSL